MKQITLSERQMHVLLNLGRNVSEALDEFRGRTPAEVATAAYSAYQSMLGLQLPSPSVGAPAPVAAPAAPVRRKRAKRAKAKPSSKVAKSEDRTVSIISVLQKSKEPLPASAIAEKLSIPGQGLGPVLNKLFSDGAITKKEVDGAYVWGPKAGSRLNGKASHAN